MSESLERVSAVIYQFPAGAVRRSRQDVEQRQRFAREAARPVNIVSGGAWYHDEAIREDGKRFDT